MGQSLGHITWGNAWETERGEHPISTLCILKQTAPLMFCCFFSGFFFFSFFPPAPFDALDSVSDSASSPCPPCPCPWLCP